MAIATIGIDLGKNSCSLAALDATGAVVLRRRLSRGNGGEMQVLEGRRPGDLIVIAFPDRARVEAWYRSAAYREILPLRLRNATGDVFLIDGVAEDHVATDILAA